MKKWISLYFLIGIIFNMNAQYEPIIKSEGVLWKLTHEHLDYPVNVEINLSDTISIDYYLTIQLLGVLVLIMGWEVM